jgi:putative ABC transport system permease protein
MNTIRQAFRSLSKSPGFSAIAVLMLALGIGLSASSFSMANAFLLRNVPYSEPDRLVRLFVTSSQSQQGSFSPGNALELRKTATTLTSLAMYNGDVFALGEPGQPAERVNGMTATANFLDVLGVKPVLGRGFVEGDDTPEKPRVALLSHRAWVRRYSADPGVLGRTVRLNTEAHIIVGVLPETFDAPLVWGPVEYIVPQTIHPHFPTEFKAIWLQVVSRLKPGVSLAQARSELSVLGANLAKEHPKENAGVGLRVVHLHDSNMDDVSRTLLWLMTAISVTMLVIACANLASLQIARAFGRSREFALRAALGAGRRQLMMPLLVESLVLAFAGGIAGLFVASWSNDIIGHYLRINDEPGFHIPFDGNVFAFAAFASVLSGFTFGLTPAWLASRAPAAEALKEGSRGSTSGSHQHLKSSLIVCELALALALVCVASSFGVGAKFFVHRQVGWDADGLFSGYLALPYNQYNDDTKNRTFQRALLEKLTVIPGVEQAVICGDLPLFYLGGGTLPLNVEGLPIADRGHEPLTQTVSVSPDYFGALRLNLKTGKLFAPSVSEKDPAVAVVNESFAKRFWPGQDAVGHRVRIGDNETWIEIIGVVGDVKLLGRFDPPETPLQLFRPNLQAPSRYVALVLRSSVSPDILTRAMRTAVASLDADIPVANPSSVRSAVERNLSNINLVIINLGISAGMGLLIAGIGLFGVISQLTQQRTRDIGVRMALGAQHADILRLVVGGGVKLLLIGIAIGVPAFFGLNRLLHTAMPAVEFPGLWLLGTNLVVLSAAMLLACYLPARRAAQVNPMDALRAE